MLRRTFLAAVVVLALAPASASAVPVPLPVCAPHVSAPAAPCLPSGGGPSSVEEAAIKLVAKSSAGMFWRMWSVLALF